MGLSGATLAGNTATDVRLSIPGWGASYVDVALDREAVIAGRRELKLADLTFSGTILSGGPGSGRSFYRLVAGAGGWGKNIARKSYVNDSGVKLGTVLGDAAKAVGETLDTTSFDPNTRLGPSFVRPEGPACRLLELVSPAAWYVGEDGVTRLGARPSSTLTSKAARVTQRDLARGTLTLASETIKGILPGIVVDGLTAVDVEHTVSAKGGLRSKIWGRMSGGASRRLAVYRALFDQLDPSRAFRGVYEYRIVTQTGNRLNLTPVRVSTGMPDLGLVFVRPGVPGSKATNTNGARVLVGFVDADPLRPVVIGFEDPDGPGFKSSALTLAASASITLDAPTGTLFPTGASVTVGAAPKPLAVAAEVIAADTLIVGVLTALTSALNAPGATVATVGAAMTTAMGTTFTTALAAADAAMPTTVLEGT